MDAASHTREMEISNRLGMHLRPVARFVGMALEFPCQVLVEQQGQSADGKSFVDMMQLSGPRGAKIRIRTQGKQALACLDALSGLVEEKFGESDLEVLETA